MLFLVYFVQVWRNWRPRNRWQKLFKLQNRASWNSAPYERLLKLKLYSSLQIQLVNYISYILVFLNVWSISLNNWSSSQTFWEFGRLVGRAAYYHGFLQSENFSNFTLVLPFFQTFCFCFLMPITDKKFYLRLQQWQLPFYVKIRPKV